MRPGDFSPGNRHVAGHGLVLVCDASMRPGDFSPGNMSGAGGWRRCTARFNEAGGFLPRKPTAAGRGGATSTSAMLQ